jgi:hypothetical protein
MSHISLSIRTKSRLSVRLIHGYMCMGWDGTPFVDGMIHVEVIPCFVWLRTREGCDEMCLSYNC